MTEKQHTPKPDDRSDNAEKLQDMIDDTVENIEAANETMQFSSGEEKQNIAEKNKRREEAIQGFQAEIKDESGNQ
ncbi:small acid-soluble spore protein Tlp [Paucisalibacillus globulus]|uniref:small acid-soluble spore protein Tlp n=1 Tax=Paucisalibacillus globulus TaxID=351095 RepID=UPI000406AF8A|nr:small acid-soluble spore protein Tlp [Paucisalibacillus globulus]